VALASCATWPHPYRWPVRSPLSWIVTALEIAFWAGGGLALYHGQPLLVSLLLCFWVLRSEGIPVPGEVAFWVLGAALIEAFSKGEMAVVALESPVAIVRVFAMLQYLSASRSARWWEEYFLGKSPYPGWSAAAYGWRQRGRVAHAGAWALALAVGVAWTAGLWWWAYTWGSRWRLPYLVVLSALALWWCVLVFRAARDRAFPLEPEDEESLAPPDWKWEAARMYTQPTGWGATDLPPATLDLATGFGGSGDRRLRHFAADCAEHVLPAESGGVGRIRGYILLTVESARRRADGDLHGQMLRMALRHADTTVTTSGRRISRKNGDPTTLRLLDDAASAAYHALCAPTPLEAARYAANCASVSVDGELREHEHAWQLQRLEDYRAQRPNPA
jgi:hypothetical protein